MVLCCADLHPYRSAVCTHGEHSKGISGSEPLIFIYVFPVDAFADLVVGRSLLLSFWR